MFPSTDRHLSLQKLWILLLLVLRLRNSISFQTSSFAVKSFQRRNEPFSDSSTLYSYNSRQNQGYLFQPRFLSNSLHSSFWENDFDREEYGISYLPIDLFHVPPRTKDILVTLTQAYIESDTRDTSSDIQIEEFLDVIDEEHKYVDLPVTIDGTQYCFDTDHSNERLEAIRIAAKLISFAAIYRLPYNIAIFLLQYMQGSPYFYGKDRVLKEFNQIVDEFRDVGSWTKIKFREGLNLRLKRQYLNSNRQKYNPVSRSSIFMKKYALQEAKAAIKEANRTKCPAKLVKKQEIEAIVEKLDMKSEFAQEEDDLLGDLLLTFFPKQNIALNKIRRLLSSKKAKTLKAAGRAGVISYCILNFLWYTGAILWNWKRFNSNPNMIFMEGRMQALLFSIRKFGRVLSTVYMGSKITMLTRLSLAILLAPFGNKILQQTKRRLKVSTDLALAILTAFMITASMLLWGVIILSDAAFGKTSIGSFAM